jgi:hypothetical protein
MGRRPIAGIAYIQTGASFLASSNHFHNLARSCADSDWRSSANQGRGSLFRYTGCTTQEIYGLGRPHGAFAAIAEVLRGHSSLARVRASREEKAASPIPAEIHVRGWLHSGGRVKRPSSSTRQANKAGRMSRRQHTGSEGPLSGYGSFSHGRAAQALGSEVRYVVIYNNGSPTEPNGVSELGLAPHRVTVLTTSTLRLKSLERSQGWG